ncbi:MAG: uroporphyrinogen-III synthase [Bryobacteraceae bacterium]
MRSLEGLRVVVTRAPHQAEELAQSLRALGANVILLPLIGIAPPLNPEPLRHAAARSHEYDWIIFTSANAVHVFAAQMPESLQIRKPRVATVGVATRETAEQLGFRVNVTPSKYVAESLIEALSPEDLNNRKVLIPSAAVTRDLVPDALRKRGAQVEVVEAYRNVIPPEAADRAAAVFREPYPDWVLFASSSAVENLVQLIGVERLRRTKIATIGPITSKTVLDHGLLVTAQAEVHTAQGLIDAVCQAASMH